MFSLEFWANRLSEKTTWTAIGLLAGVVGTRYTPEEWSVISDAGVALMLVFLTFYNRPKKPEELSAAPPKSDHEQTKMPKTQDPKRRSF